MVEMQNFASLFGSTNEHLLERQARAMLLKMTEDINVIKASFP